MPLPQAAPINVADMFSQPAHDQFHNQTLAVGAGITDILALIRKLFSSNLISDALTILDMWTNDGKYTLAQFKSAISSALSKLGINLLGPDAPRAIQKMLASEDGDESEKVAAVKRPSREEVIRHLEAKGVDVKALNVGNPALLWAIISLAIKFGLPFLESLIEKIVQRQHAHEKLTFLDLIPE